MVRKHSPFLTRHSEVQEAQQICGVPLGRALRSKPRTAKGIANLIDRFLMAQVGIRRNGMDSYCKRCGLLDPLVNSTGPQDAKALSELKSMVDDFRWLATPG